MDRGLRMSLSRKWRRRMILVSVLAVSAATTSGFVLNPPTTHLRATSLAVVASALEQMTVKELRQVLKNADLQERGLLSRLKRKQDLVDYLSQHLPQQQGDEAPTSDRINGETSISSNDTADQPKQVPRMPLYMPPEEPASPKEVLFEHLYERYPPLKLADTSSGDDDVDVRQIYHPMLRNATASDMDIIFVGTASCTPGTTRGVSCTALRLNWRRRCLPTSSITGRAPEYSCFTGGTWLFDVGECTQVSCMLFIRILSRAQDETRDAGTSLRATLELFSLFRGDVHLFKYNRMHERGR